MRLGNRIAMALIGACLLAAGVLGILTSRGWVEDATIESVIPFRRVWEWWSDHDWGATGVQWAVAGVALGAGAIALVLLVLELRRRRRRETLLVQETPRGRTVVSERALRDGLAAEALSAPGVASVRVGRLAHGEEGMAVDVRARVDGDGPLVELGTRMAERSVRSLETMLGRPVARVGVEVEPAASRRGRVRERRVV